VKPVLEISQLFLGCPRSLVLLLTDRLVVVPIYDLALLVTIVDELAVGAKAEFGHTVAFLLGAPRTALWGALVQVRDLFFVEHEFADYLYAGCRDYYGRGSSECENQQKGGDFGGRADERGG